MRRNGFSRRTVVIFLCYVTGLVVLASYYTLLPRDGLLADRYSVVDRDRGLAVNGNNDGLIQEHVNTTNGGEQKRQSTLLRYKPILAPLYKRLVCLTAISDFQFAAAKEMFTSVYRCLPDKKVIVYDLGLSAKSRDQVRSYPNVELRTFPFSDYTHLAHVSNLHTYAWKPIIIKLVSQQYDVIMYGDATLRMKSCDMSSALEHLLKFPLLNIHPISHHTIEFTHDGMIKYLQYPKARIDMAGVKTLEASGWLIMANPQLKERVIEPWLDCALHQECIAPEGTQPWSCWFTSKHDGHYVGCHRYDQSAMMLIMAREFGLDFESKASNTTISDQLWVIKK